MTRSFLPGKLLGAAFIMAACLLTAPGTAFSVEQPPEARNAPGPIFTVQFLDQGTVEQPPKARNAPGPTGQFMVGGGIKSIAGVNGSIVLNERNFDTAQVMSGQFMVGGGINSNVGLNGSIVLNERNFDTGRVPPGPGMRPGKKPLRDLRPEILRELLPDLPPETLRELLPEMELPVDDKKSSIPQGGPLNSSTTADQVTDPGDPPWEIKPGYSGAFDPRMLKPKVEPKDRR
jgi:hypothetical protein